MKNLYNSSSNLAIRRCHLGFLLAWICGCFSVTAQDHPRLILTQEGISQIRENLGTAPLFDQRLKMVQMEVDQAIADGMDVPIPKDMAGGYTHERHKQNYSLMQKAGNLYQITEEEKYAVYVRDMLLEYAKLYPSLELHPTHRSYATGKIFWQCLNDANWLVYSSQAYDCVYDWLKPSERDLLEKDLFRPFADFLSLENPRFFNRIHNHSTWGNAAVGMIGLVMGDSILINRALYGLENDGISAEEKDNDEGFIKQPGQNTAGFLAQLDFSFSPDGYFTEGPYYLRYAIFPFLLFSKALANNRPDLDIFHYRDDILMKAVYALLYQADARGHFFPINDAQKGMSWLAREVITAADIAYYYGGNDPGLLSIVHKQGKVLLDETGFVAARDLARGIAKPFHQKSIAFTDGADGNKGGVGILRSSRSEGEEVCLVMKYSAQGMGHGHFDKLSYSLYDEGGEIIQDYGAARWVNIEQKGGGRYLPENKSWAKQSIAHNTLVIDETSHYEGDIKKGEANQPVPFLFSSQDDMFQLVSAKDTTAYTGTDMHRTMILLKRHALHPPIVIDIIRAQSGGTHQYDLPIWFHGHLLSTSFDYTTQEDRLLPLGEAHGYQHIWKEAVGRSKDQHAQITWFSRGKFFTASMLVSPNDELILGRTGASDPSFNLRHDPGFIIRKKEAKDPVFVTVIEPHGAYNPVSEIPTYPFSRIASVDLLHNDDRYTAISVKDKSDKAWTVILANRYPSPTIKHKLTIDQMSYTWQGGFHLLKQ
ncbi:MAG: heparinase II/III family protein [Bacteroidota bacterium]